MTPTVTTLRDIITEFPDSLWLDNAGDVWDCDNILDQWGEDLNREAICIDGAVRFLGADGNPERFAAALIEIVTSPESDGELLAVAIAVLTLVDGTAPGDGGSKCAASKHS